MPADVYEKRRMKQLAKGLREEVAGKKRGGITGKMQSLLGKARQKSSVSGYKEHDAITRALRKFANSFGEM
jgi:hypothetical protein